MALHDAGRLFVAGFTSAYMTPMTVLAASIAAGRQARGTDGLLKALRYAGAAAYRASALAASGEIRHFRSLWNSPGGPGQLAAYGAGLGIGLFTHIYTPFSLYKGVQQLRRGQRLRGLLNLGFGMMGVWSLASGAWQLSRHVSPGGLNTLMGGRRS